MAYMRIFLDEKKCTHVYRFEGHTQNDIFQPDDVQTLSSFLT